LRVDRSGLVIERSADLRDVDQQEAVPKLRGPKHVHLAFGFDIGDCASALHVRFQLGGAWSWRSALSALLVTVASRAGRHPVTHHELDLAAVDADVPQRTIVEPAELENGAAPPSFGG
jgi:hypothetical protein